MPGVRIGSLVAIGTLRRLSWGGEENAALRTTHAFTLGARLNKLTDRYDRYDRYMTVA